MSGRLGKHLNIGFLILLFFLQFAEYNLKAPPYSKTLITWEWSYSCAPTLYSRIYSQDLKNSSCVNVALENAKFWLFHFIFFTIETAFIKGAIWFIVGGYSKEPWRAPCPLRNVNKASWFFHISVQINFSSSINLQRNGSIKMLPGSGLLLSLYELMKLGVLANEHWNGPKIKNGLS